MSDSTAPGRDFRVHAISSLAEEFISPWTGQIHPAGTEVLLVGSTAFDWANVLEPVSKRVVGFLPSSGYCRRTIS
jgi:hypothetical protein